MAELNKTMFGNVKGKFGKAVFKQRNGLNYISQKPSSFTVPTDEGYIKRTNKFKIAAKISSLVNSNSFLKEKWLEKAPKGLSTYNLLISKNYSAVIDPSVSDMLVITPESKIGVRQNSLLFTEDKLTVTLKPLTVNSMIDTEIEKKIQLITLIYFYEPVNGTPDSFDAILVSSPLQSFDLETQLTFEIPLSTNEQKKLVSYNSKSTHSAIITYDVNENPVNCSTTF